MKEPRQTVMAELGDEGCYLLCIVDIGEEVTRERIDAIPVFLQGVERGIVQKNCLVNDAAALLESMTGCRWEKRYEGPDYEPKEGEYEIRRYERKSGSGTIVHFARKDYDPYKDSRTVREGVLESKRIFRRLT